MSFLYNVLLLSTYPVTLLSSYMMSWELRLPQHRDRHSTGRTTLKADLHIQADQVQVLGYQVVECQAVRDITQ